MTPNMTLKITVNQVYKEGLNVKQYSQRASRYYPSQMNSFWSMARGMLPKKNRENYHSNK